MKFFSNILVALSFLTKIFPHGADNQWKILEKRKVCLSNIFFKKFILVGFWFLLLFLNYFLKIVTLADMPFLSSLYL